MTVGLSSVFTMVSCVTVTTVSCLLVITCLTIITLYPQFDHLQLVSLHFQDVHSWRTDGYREAMDLIPVKNSFE